MSKKPVYADAVKNRKPEELRRLAIDIADGKVFGSWMVEDPQMIPMVFLVLAFAGPASVPKNCFAVFEYLDKATPRGINGMPTFLSCQILTKADVVFLQPEVKRLVQAKKNYIAGSKPASQEK